MLKMKIGQVIPYTDTCNYLGNTICSHDENVIIDNAIIDMNMRLNNVLFEFSHCDSCTLSTLFRTYCMNIYGSQTWRYNGSYFGYILYYLEKGNSPSLENTIYNA